MASKLIVIAAISLNAVLWSQSRYVTTHYDHFVSSQSSLQRSPSGNPRVGFILARSWETLVTSANHSESQDIDSSLEKCRPLSHPVKQQCSHVIQSCDAPETVLSIPYLEDYFCAKPPARPAYFVALVLWLVFLFSFIGITASDFFCPNLDTIAKFFGLSENITGVTFLAFGNGSPDVFATYSAMRNNSGSLAVGELLGAASFIVSVVVGSMCIIKPFHVRKGPFLRDVGFFAAAVALLLFILYDGKIEVWEAAALVGLYGLYVVAVVAVTWWGNRRRAQRDHEDLVRREYADDTTSTPISYTQDERYQDEPESFSRDSLSPLEARTRTQSQPTLPHLTDSHHNSLGRLSQSTGLPRRLSSFQSSPQQQAVLLQRRTSHTALPSFSLIGALEFRSVVNSLQKDSTSAALDTFDETASPYSAGHYSRRLSRPGRTDSRRSSAGNIHSRSGTNIHDQERDPWDAVLADAAVPLSERVPSPIPDLPLHVDTDVQTPRPALSNRVDSDLTSASIPDINIIASSPPVSRVLRPLLPASPDGGDPGPRGRQPLPPIAFPTAPARLHMPHDLASYDGASFATAHPPERTADDIAARFKKPQIIKTTALQVYHTLFPTLQNFMAPYKSWTGRVVGLLAAPAVLFLTLTLPVVISSDDDDPEHDPEPRKDGLSISEGRLVDLGRDRANQGKGLPHYSLSPSSARYRDNEEEDDMDLRTEEDDERDGESDVSSIVSDIEKDMHGSRFNKVLLEVQCVVGPVFVVAVLFSQTEYIWIFLLAAAIGGLSAACLVGGFAKTGRHPAGRIARSLMGFAVAVVWIMAIADEVVQVLQTFGLIFGLSNAIVGLTIFAIGNSLADFVANLSVAVFAPVMGFSACFGGPMLNILLGVGISGSIVLRQRGEPYYPINFSTTLFVSSIGLLALLLITMIFVPLNGYLLSKRWGIFLIVCYTILMAVNVGVEIKQEM